jgi:phage recombination protein Bet
MEIGSMNTKTAIKPTVTEMSEPSEKREVAVFQPPRLPYHSALKERFGIEPSGWKTLVEAIYPNAKSIDSIVLALSYCKARGLDPFKRPIHIVPMWSTRGGPDGTGGYVESIWPGIAELRTTAFRTKNYAGCDEAEFGRSIDKTFTGRVKNKGNWEDKSITLSFPEWCRITVYRDLGGRICKFVGPKVKWLEAYAAIGRSDLPNEMWETRPEGQIEKCAEAAALRKAFPEELGNELTADEMSGRVIHDDRPDAPDRVVRSNEGPPAPETVKGANAAPKETIDNETGEVIDAEPVEAEPAEGKPATSEFANWRKDAEGALSGCTDQESLADVHKRIIKPAHGKVAAQDWEAVFVAYRQTFDRIVLEEAQG